MGIVAPPSKCPACGGDVPWGSDVGGGVHRYECISCRHVFEVRAVAPAPAPAFAPAPMNPYAAPPQLLIPAPLAAPMVAKVCAACGKENPPHYKFCLGCGGDLSHAAPPGVVGRAAPAARARSRVPRALVGGILGFNGIFWALFAFLFMSPRACAAFSPGNEDLALETLKKCPRARQILGDDVSPAWFGCTNGSSQGGCDSENAHWSTNVEGSKGRGDFAWAAQETNGTWTIKGAWLRVAGEEIDIVQCNTKGAAKSEDVEIDDND